MEIFCSHRIIFSRNVFGDEINHLDARSIFYCEKCGKRFLSDRLINENEIYNYGNKKTAHKDL